MDFSYVQINHEYGVKDNNSDSKIMLQDPN